MDQWMQCETRVEQARAFPANSLASVKAEIRTPVAVAQLLNIHLPHRIDHRLVSGSAYRLDLSLSGRPSGSKARYTDRWNSHHFEAIGEMFLLRGDDEVHAISEAGEGHAVVCDLEPISLHRWFGGEMEWTDHHLSGSLDIASPAIKGLLYRMGTEVRRPGFASDVMIELLAGEVAIELRRWCSTFDKVAMAGGLAPWRLRLIEERLHDGDAAVTLAELAELCRLSARQLTRGFKSSRGCSLGKYIADSRIARARTRLASGACASVVARELGFGTQSSFAYAFRRATGQSPSAFRTDVTRRG